VRICQGARFSAVSLIGGSQWLIPGLDDTVEYEHRRRAPLSMNEPEQQPAYDFA
jgi:hypothetical protein